MEQIILDFFIIPLGFHGKMGYNNSIYECSKGVYALNRSFLKILSALMLALMLVSYLPQTAEAGTPHVSISVSPNELAQAGNVTVTIALRNTNSVPTETQPPAETPDPGEPGDGGSSPVTPSRGGSYTDITISNAYGVSFNTSGVSVAPATNTTFTGTMYVTDEMIGVDLTFTVYWTEDGERRSESVTTKIKRRNVAPYLSVTRTANPVSAAPGTDVTFKYTFTNTGSVTLVNIELSDRAVYGRSGAMYKIQRLEPGASDEFTYVMRMGQSTVVSSPTVTFYAQGGTTQLVNNVSSLTVGVIQSQLTKEVIVGTPTPEGVLFTLYLTNNGNQKLSNLKVTDELGNSVSSSDFSLAVGEYKVLEYYVHNPQEVRYLVFYIRGNDKNGTEFRDNTESFPVRPYIDRTKEGLTFSAVTTSSMNEEHVIGVEFSVMNTGLLDLYKISVTEQTLGYELHRWETLAPQQSDKIEMDVNIGEVRDLVFVLTAEDSSGNVYTYESHVSAEQIDVDALVPYHDPSKDGANGIGVVDEETGLGKKLDSLITMTGSKLQRWFRVLGIIAAVAALCMLALGISEIVIRRNRRTTDKGPHKQ